MKSFSLVHVDPLYEGVNGHYEIAVFCVMMPCSDVVGYQRFGKPCCLYLQDEDGGNMILLTTSLHGVTTRRPRLEFSWP